MMKHTPWTPYLAIAALFIILASTNGDAKAQTAPQPSLCHAGETIFFNCVVEHSGKIASLCGIGNLAEGGRLRYRFGRSQHLELNYPNAGQGIAQFAYSHYSRFRVNRTLVSFKEGSHHYRIFDDQDGDIQPPRHQLGVQVNSMKGREKHVTLYCGTPAVSDLQGLRDILPCNKRDPLNMGSCSKP